MSKTIDISPANIIEKTKNYNKLIKIAEEFNVKKYSSRRHH